MPTESSTDRKVLVEIAVRPALSPSSVAMGASSDGVA